MGSSLTTKIQKWQLYHLLLYYKEWAICRSSEGWRGVFQPISLPIAPRVALWERRLSSAFLYPAFPAGQYWHLAPHAKRHEIYLEAHSLPRKLWCLIWHRKFLSGARHWTLMLGTAKLQTFMSGALRSFQLQGAQKIGLHLVTALTVCEGSQKNLYCRTCLLPDKSFWTNMFLQKGSFTGAEMFQHFLIFIRGLPESFLRSWLWFSQCRLDLEGARKTAWERKTWNCQAELKRFDKVHFHEDIRNMVLFIPT